MSPIMSHPLKRLRYGFSRFHKPLDVDKTSFITSALSMPCNLRSIIRGTPSLLVVTTYIPLAPNNK